MYLTATLVLILLFSRIYGQKVCIPFFFNIKIVDVLLIFIFKYIK